MQNKKIIFLHRGLHGKNVPENSLAAFENAAASGYAIELDVRLSADGIPVVFHDKTLKRMCGDKRKVSELALDELKKLRLDGTDVTIPSLAEVLGLIDGRVPILIETKTPKHRIIHVRKLERSIIPLLKEYNGEYYLQSFDRGSMKYLKRRLPETKCGILSGNMYSEPLGFDFINYKLADLSAEKVKRLREKYPAVLGWSTGRTNIKKGESAMAELKLDGIII